MKDLANKDCVDKFQNWQSNFKYIKTDLGLTNDNYLLAEKFLLRQSCTKTNFFIQRTNEIEALKLNALKAINVPVVTSFFDRKQNFIYVTKFLPLAKNLAHLELNKTNLKATAQLINKLHQIDYQSGKFEQLDMKKNLINHIKLGQYNYQNKPLNKIIVGLINFLENFNWKEKIVLSHNDTLKENFLFDNQTGKWYLIDYEYCSLNTPYYDIAVFASANQLVKRSDLLSYWLELFQVNKATEKEKILYFILYRDVLGYFWAKTMNINKPDYKYVQLMQKKLKQGMKTSQLLAKMSLWQKNNAKKD